MQPPVVQASAGFPTQLLNVHVGAPVAAPAFSPAPMGTPEKVPTPPPVAQSTTTPLEQS
eukprot:CAMPEP_0179177722 /NCGR_PEP_ID=MMETSP0796-20121207/87895_1 /TAXON_ID=73915 /ORGANISM="Pyrodinium bahamense, Strain pbaha01" /LENGTH=58 /DNA_ID=CAMNT_0020881279 /DNA_START=69 /DNA_END=242 /DNA_ORIENTATION=+